ncbi:DHA2 family efflux MFS transporter permease subunit [Xanthobacter sp. DSM 24535]|uniref:DHA2 family efflux MFS transporter permease subunit n=1 Tax=Roseixanthobacter psychrophilus TaxID=3119917 RepID=UPI003728C3F9
MSGPSASGERSATLRTWLGFAAMCTGMFMAILDIQVVSTSLFAIRDALAIDPEQISWIQTAYLTAEILAIAITGLFTRAFGVRVLFAAAVGVFTLASIACAASGGFEMLIISRVVQGFSGGMLIPLVFSTVFLLFPDRLQGPATTLAGMLAVLGPVAGPVVGGWLTARYSWHWLFLINVLPGVFACGLGLALLDREKWTPQVLRTLDGLGLGLLFLSLVALEIGLKEAPERGWLSILVLALFAISALCGALFVLGSARPATLARAPVLRLDTFRDADFATGCALSFVLGMGLYGSVYLMPAFLGLVSGKNPLGIGMVMLVTGVTQLLTSPVAVALERRVSTRLLSVCGFCLFGVGLAMSAFATVDTDFAGMFWPQVVRGAAIMLCLLPPTRLALGTLRPEVIPDASSLFNLMRNLGGAIGIALIDTVLFTRVPIHAEALRQRLLAGDAGAAILVGLPPDLVQAPMQTPVSPDVEALVRPLVEKAALVLSINEAWAMLAVLAFAAALLAIGRRSQR